MRTYGEKYIEIYRPSIQKIKLIRAIRICKTPALGGKVIICKSCHHKHYLYYSCGHSHCPICQSIKREQWVDKLSARLLSVPYVHTTFTLPHQLNGVARNNPSQIYNLLMRTAWATIKELSNKDRSDKVLPGMTAVLHTFGSDMKYHVHVHCLVTFGGWNDNDQWVYPAHKYKIARYRTFSSTYRDMFLSGLEKLFYKKKITYHQEYVEFTAEIRNKRWVVHNTRPTINTKVLENYLARYVNRVAISNSRLRYVEQTQQVHILYNDYRRQEAGKPAPKSVRKLSPLIAIHQMMQHVLPPYYQKSRHYGLHASATISRIKNHIPESLKRNGQTIRTLFEILTQLLKQKPYGCKLCGDTQYDLLQVASDKNWIMQYIGTVKGRSPPPLIPFQLNAIHK